MNITPAPRIRKRTKVLLTVLAAFLVVAAYGGASILAWMSFADRLTDQKSAYESLSEQALANDSSQTDRVKALSTLATKLKKEREGLCDQTWPYAWQEAVIPPLRDGVEQCRDTKTKLDKITPNVISLSAYLDVADQLTEALSELSGTTVTEKTFTSEGQQKVEQIRTKVQAIKTDDAAAKRLASKADSQLGDISTQWSALIAANKAQDVSKYQAAAEKLTSAYADLNELADMVDEDIQKLVQALKESTD